MVVDSSAVIAIIAGESGAESLVAALASADVARMSASYLVAGIVHPAQPNYTDCSSYALAIALALDRGEPLLFMGEDFGHTDVGVASW